jgi:hypothetical protein
MPEAAMLSKISLPPLEPDASVIFPVKRKKPSPESIVPPLAVIWTALAISRSLTPACACSLPPSKVSVPVPIADETIPELGCPTV